MVFGSMMFVVVKNTTIDPNFLFLVILVVIEIVKMLFMVFHGLVTLTMVLINIVMKNVVVKKDILGWEITTSNSGTNNLFLKVSAVLTFLSTTLVDT